MKVTTEAAMGLIGGTLGLLTGFSILSGVFLTYMSIPLLLPDFCFFKVEIIYYLLKFFWSLRFSNPVVYGANKMIQNYLTKKD